MRLVFVLTMLVTSLLNYFQVPQENGKNPHGHIDMECSLCHNTRNWQTSPDSISFDHEKTGFRLNGQHGNTACRGCHSNLVFSNIGVACVDCHEDVHKSELGFQCQECHTPASWTNVQEIFATHNETRFPLIGVHAIVDCEACHSTSDPYEYKMTPLSCDQCHRQVYVSSENPNHIEAAFATDCASCHSLAASSWYQTYYSHPRSFLLRGGHLTVDCNGCHQESYAGTANTCADCHMKDYLSSHDPDHAKFGFPTICERCHNENSWGDAVFDHLEASGFELRGAHLSIQCLTCHVNNQTSGLARDCFGCHDNDFNGAKDPDHVSGQFSQDCLQCHSEMAWTPSTFDHNLTQFPLSGAHSSVTCINCHINGQYTGIATDCWSCHENDYVGVTDPNHVQGQYSHDCRQCHSDMVWTPSNFDHNQTQFPLSGAHSSVACINCHTNGQYTGTPTDCWSCHENDYVAVTDPNHAQAQYAHDCTQCHTDMAWSPSTFDHNKTQFPLSGAHVSITCSSCHINSQYAGTLTDCWSCHENDYLGVTDPNHAQAQFDHNCLQCHTDMAWSPATFDHSATTFPLTGAHVTTVCTDCHKNGQYSGLPAECLSCHESEYNATTDPIHTAAGFPVTCENCHNTIAWDQTTWDHDSQYFPIYSGAHRGKWDTCAECHLSPGDYKQFECIFCHEHNETDMAEKHKERNDYLYQSNACYDCHPNGRSEGN